MPNFYADFKFACKWAVSKKLVTDFAQIFVCEISIYLFGLYLLFKSLCMFLGIKLYDLTLNLQNAPLKFKIKAFKISKTKKLLAKTSSLNRN
ncbi:hypothetical protein [Staphylococcus xylosus]|uniref:hypothetical protein n=1 Tax=Staphylococcus xylosus TaxID=1288 RepID=UPI0009BF3390|nr:hypothetical protein [Staphylococcus xylosus]RIM68169.1 hypothetical protein BU119_11255 [Staphylococcus xylosus]